METGAMTRRDWPLVRRSSRTEAAAVHLRSYQDRRYYRDTARWLAGVSHYDAPGTLGLLVSADSPRIPARVARTMTAEYGRPVVSDTGASSWRVDDRFRSLEARTGIAIYRGER